MNYRRFGRTKWKVSEIGYGMWGMGGWSGSDDEESLKALQHAVDQGCNFFDTAWAEASACLVNWCVRTRIGSSIRPQRFRRRTRLGPAGANLLSTKLFLPIISSNVCTRV